jgi:hypothetical protein
VHNLEPATAAQQAVFLAYTLSNKNIGLVVIADAIKRKMWLETKEVAKGFKSDSARNPKSGNNIATWTITRKMIPLIYHYGDPKYSTKQKAIKAKAKEGK